MKVENQFSFQWDFLFCLLFAFLRFRLNPLRPIKNQNDQSSPKICSSLKSASAQAKTKEKPFHFKQLHKLQLVVNMPSQFQLLSIIIIIVFLVSDHCSRYKYVAVERNEFKVGGIGIVNLFYIQFSVLFFINFFLSFISFAWFFFRNSRTLNESNFFRIFRCLPTWRYADKKSVVSCELNNDVGRAPK